MTAPANTPEERARESAAAIRFRVLDSLVFESKAPTQDEAHKAARPNGALHAIKEASAAVGALAAEARAQQASAADATIATAAPSAAPQAPSAPQTRSAAPQASSRAKQPPNGAKQSRADGERPSQPEARELQELRATIQALESYIEGRQQSWTVLEAKFIDIETQLASREQEVAGKEAQLLAHFEDNSRLNSRVLELEHSCTDLDARRAQQEAVNEELKARLTAEVAHAAKLKSDVVEAAKRSDATVEKLTQQEKHVAALEAAGSQRERWIAELTATLQERRRVEVELTAAKNTLVARVAELERDMAERLKQIETLEASSALAEARFRDSQQRVGELKRRWREVADKVITLRTKPSPGARAVNAPTAAADAAKPVSAPRPRARSGRKMLVAMGRGSVANYTLNAGETTIGRSPECDIQISSKYLSRWHARIAVRNAEAVIEDLASANGVCVNSKPIEKSARLKDGDIILLGVLEFQYVDVGSARRRADATAIQPARAEVTSIQPAATPPTEPAPTPIR